MTVENLKDVFEKIIPKYENHTYAIYEDDKFLCFADYEKLIKSYGRYDIDLNKINEDSEIHIKTPDTYWFKDDEIECMGYAGGDRLLMEGVDGVFTYCVGTAYETGFIYIDMGFKIEDGEISIFAIKETDNNKDFYIGRGTGGSLVYIPDHIIETLLEITKKDMKKYVDPDIFIEYVRD